MQFRFVTYIGLFALALAGDCRFSLADGAAPNEIPVVEPEAASQAFLTQSAAAKHVHSRTRRLRFNSREMETWWNGSDWPAHSI